jgi:hypothetical protein
VKDHPAGWSEKMQAGWARWWNERAEADPVAFEREAPAEAEPNTDQSA